MQDNILYIQWNCAMNCLLVVEIINSGTLAVFSVKITSGVGICKDILFCFQLEFHKLV
jgi:hypothetical protein